MRISDWSSDVCSSDLAGSTAKGGRSARFIAARIAHSMTSPRNGIGSVSQYIVRKTSAPVTGPRSEEHTSELQSLIRISYADFCLKKKKTNGIGTSDRETRRKSMTKGQLHVCSPLNNVYYD